MKESEPNTVINMTLKSLNIDKVFKDVLPVISLFKILDAVAFICIFAYLQVCSEPRK